MYKFIDTNPIDTTEHTVTGDIVTIDNSDGLKDIRTLAVSIEPIQDLNGYDKPWSGGNGDNKLGLVTDIDKTVAGVRFTFDADTGTFTVNGTNTNTSNHQAQVWLANSSTALFPNFQVGETYTLFVDNTSLPMYMQFTYRDTSNAVGALGYCNFSYGHIAFTIPENFATLISFQMYIAGSATTLNATFHAWLVKGSVSTSTFTPYSNICPISGRTEVVTQRTGKNLLDLSKWETDKNSGLTVSGDALTIINKGYQETLNRFKLIDERVYTFSFRFQTLALSDSRALFAVYIDGRKAIPTEGATNVGNLLLQSVGTETDVVVPIPSTAKEISFGGWAWGGTVNVTNIQLELGTTATEYEPFGETYTTALGRTVYGGTLDVVSGELVVDRAMATLVGGNWTKSSSYPGGFYIANNVFPTAFGAPEPKYKTPFICSHASTAKTITEYVNGTCYSDNSTNIRIMSADTTVSEWSQYLVDQNDAGTPVEVCYELAEPQTYNLTPQQVESLIGTNNVWAEQGEVRVAYANDLNLLYALPSEAVMINGAFLENIIDGYRTLYVKGRETLSAEVELGEVGVRDGGYLKNKRFPSRELTIGYQIVAHTNEEFNAEFQKLNDALNVEDAQIIFADETDKYLIGTPSGFGDVPHGELSVKGEYTILCADPFKYSVTEYEVSPTLDDGSTFYVDYQGTYPAFPVLEAHFYKSASKNNTDGDCGFVAFSTQNADVLQFGNPEEPDTINEKVEQLVNGETDTWTEKKMLVNEPFDTISGWTTNDGWTGSDLYVKAGTATTGTLGSGTDKAVKASSYGATSNSQWHGCTVKKTLPSDGGSPATVGANDWICYGQLRFASHKTAKTGKGQAGMIRIAVLDANSKAVAGISIAKKKGSSQGNVSLFVNGEKVKTFKNIDLSYYNNRFGYKKRAKDKRPCAYNITKQGNKITFKVSSLTFTYTLANLGTAKSVSIYLAQWGSVPAVSYMGVYSCQFQSTSVTKTKTTQTVDQLTKIVEVVNTFSTNDILVCDCSDGSVRMQNAFATEETNGGLRPDLGALGNDWERFMLTKGSNQIGTMYSEWVADAHKPTFKLKYRERFL